MLTDIEKDALKKLFDWIYFRNNNSTSPAIEELQALRNISVSDFIQADPENSSLEERAYYKKLLPKVHPDKTPDCDKPISQTIFLLINNIFKHNHEQVHDAAQTATSEPITLLDIQFTDVDKKTGSEYKSNFTREEQEAYFKKYGQQNHTAVIKQEAIKFVDRFAQHLKIECGSIDTSEKIAEKRTKLCSATNQFLTENQRCLPQAFVGKMASHNTFVTIFAQYKSSPLYDFIFEQLANATITASLKEGAYENPSYLFHGETVASLSDGTMDRLFYLWKLYRPQFPDLFPTSKKLPQKRVTANLNNGLFYYMSCNCPSQMTIDDLYIRYHEEIGPLQAHIGAEKFTERFTELFSYCSIEGFERIYRRCFEEEALDMFQHIAVQDFCYFLRTFLPHYPELCITAIKAKHEALMLLALRDGDQKSNQVAVYNETTLRAFLNIFFQEEKRSFYETVASTAEALHFIFNQIPRFYNLIIKHADLDMLVKLRHFLDPKVAASSTALTVSTEFMDQNVIALTTRFIEEFEKKHTESTFKTTVNNGLFRLFGVQNGISSPEQIFCKKLKEILQRSAIGLSEQSFAIRMQFSEFFGEGSGNVCQHRDERLPVMALLKQLGFVTLLPSESNVALCDFMKCAIPVPAMAMAAS